MTRVTLDTNILISGTFWTGSSFVILDLVDKKELTLVLSKEILAEYERVIKSEEIMDKIEEKKLAMSKSAERVIYNSEIVEPKTRLSVIKDDPTDNKFLECAKEGKAKFIISNDYHLLDLKEFEGIKILGPEQFLQHEFQKTTKQLLEDLEFARRTEEAWKRYEKGKFTSLSFDEFIKEMKKW